MANGDDNQKWYQKTWVKVVMAVFGLILLGAIVTGIVFAVKGKPPVSNTTKSSTLSVSANPQHSHMQPHPIEQQANAVFDATQGHPALHGCFAPVSANYDPAQDMLQGSPSLVPPYQAALKSLPAMQTLNFQQEFPGNNIGPNTREGIDTLATTSLDASTRSEDDDFHARVQQTEGVGVSNIYSRGDRKGIALINQKSRMVDPTKMLPQVDPARQSERMVQAGPSIADIGCRVPKSADIMRLLRASRGAALSHSIPRDKPPVYTEGLNAFRPTPLPASTFGGGGCTIGISPYEVSDLIDYAPNPFLHSSRAAGAPYNYTVGATTQ